MRTAQHKEGQVGGCATSLLAADGQPLAVLLPDMVLRVEPAYRCWWIEEGC